MSNSKYVSYTKLSPNCSERTAKISKITIHHMATVNGSLSGMGDWFSRSSTRASSNYGIDSNGKVALYVDESKRAWTSSNAANDNVAVTIEVANSTGAPEWKVNDTAYKALIDLCVDICERNDIKELVYTGDKNGNLTRHDMFANTTCPGPYLGSKFPEIAAEVNARLKKENYKPVPTPSNKSLKVGSAGQEVKNLQNNLNGLNYNCGTADGVFGNQTKNAVIRFQKAYSLVQDGIAGPITLAKIKEVVKDLQTRLNKLGYSCGAADGIFGNQTKNAVVAFQKKSGIAADGVVGKQTYAALEKAEKSKEPYQIKVTASLLNIRSGPSTSYPVVGQIKDKGIYTIMEEKNGWGKLKSGAGWIYLGYTKKV